MSACVIRIAERVDHVTAGPKYGGTSALQKLRNGEGHATPQRQKTILFSLTINGLGHKNTSSADLSEQLAGA
jgi:hypothetical protein